VIAHSEWQHGRIFDGISASGHTVRFDAAPAHAEGPSPMEAVLMALCGCTSVDVVSILEKKRQPLTGLRVTATAEQAGAPPEIFTHIKLTYAVRGRVSRKAVEDTVALSRNKYCSVALMLDKAAAVDYEIVYPEGEPEP
jgi:putative redox protein